MKIKLQFELQEKKITRNYRSSILSFIKSNLEKTDKKYYESLYEAKNKKMKDFTFSCFFPNSKIDENIEIESNYFAATFSMLKYETFIELYNAFNFARDKEFKIENNTIILKNIIIPKDRVIKKGKVIIKFLSPLVIRSKKNKNIKDDKKEYLTFDDENFLDALNLSISNMANVLNFENIKYSKIELTPYKKEEKLLASSTVVPFKNFHIPASYGKFILIGDTILLNYLYKTGVGSRRSEGFGMFEIFESFDTTEEIYGE